MAETPNDPFGGMTVGAVSLHEQYAAFITAGFTPSEAMEILLTMIRETLRYALNNGGS